MRRVPNIAELMELTGIETYASLLALFTEPDDLSSAFMLPILPIA